MQRWAVLSAILFLVASVQAQQGDRKQSTVMGTVKSVDAKAKTVTLEGRKRDGGQVDADATYSVADTAKIILQGQQKTLADLTAGTQVLVSFAEDGKTVTALVLARRPQDRGRGQVVSGVLTKVDGKTLTITRRGDGGEEARAVMLDATTKVRVETAEDMVVKGDGGTERKVPKVKDGAAADLQVGKQVQVTVGANDKAIQVLVLRAGRKG